MLDHNMLTCQESKGAFDKTTYTYEYDEAGNRTFAKKEKLYSYLESWQIRYTYNDDNQMTAAKKREGNLTKEYTFTYDANGNLLRECFKNKPEVTYQYDTENRLKAVSDPQKLLMASTYDGDGNRAFQLNYNPDAECGYGKNVNGEIFMPEHSHNEDGSLTAEGELFGYICSATGRAYDLTEYVNDTNREHTEVLTAFNINTGFDTESYTYAGSSRLSRNNIWNEARDVNHDEMSYYLYDGQGSVTANTWYNGMVTDVYQYDPYGRMELGGEGHTDFYGYRAESYNPNTGLEYLRARYYNADKGRFFQEDTYLGDITDPLTLNRYAYVKNSPLNYADPGGHKWTVAGLNQLFYQFRDGIISEQKLSIELLKMNGGNLFYAFHQIAQIHAAKKIYQKTNLEVKLENAYYKGETKSCKINVDIAAGYYIWEVKSQGFWWNRQKFEETDEQIERYLKFANSIGVPLQRAPHGIVQIITDIPVIGQLKMEVAEDPITNGLLFYSIYIENSAGEKVRVNLTKANTEADKELELEKAKDIIEDPDAELGKVAIETGVVAVAGWAFIKVLETLISAYTGIPIVAF